MRQKTIAILGRANHLLEMHVHPRVAAHEMAVVRLAVLQLHQLRGSSGEGVRSSSEFCARGEGRSRGVRDISRAGSGDGGVHVVTYCVTRSIDGGGRRAATHHGVALRGLEQRERQHLALVTAAAEGGSRHRACEWTSGREDDRDRSVRRVRTRLANDALVSCVGRVSARRVVPAVAAAPAPFFQGTRLTSLAHRGLLRPRLGALLFSPGAVRRAVRAVDGRARPPWKGTSCTPWCS